MSLPEHACLAKERLAHAKKLDPLLNDSCGCITACLKKKMYAINVLARILPQNIKISVTSKME